MARLPESAQRLELYRRYPSKWVEHHLDIELARYRDRAALEAFLERSPHPHRWARRQLAAGKLQLDASRSYQADILDLVARPLREGRLDFVHRVALPCANGVGKTSVAAMIVHWFLNCFPGGKCATTAGTWSQLREQLWREIATWAQRVRRPIVTASDAVLKTGIDIAPDWMAFGRAAKSEATFEGVHGAYTMLLLDEAKAIKPEIFDAARRILRGHGAMFLVVLSSPGSRTGPFFDICHGDASATYATHRMSAYESERIPLEQIEEDVAEIGEESPLFVAMDLGEFPEEGEGTVIPLSHAQAAVDRAVDTWTPEGGLDAGKAEWKTLGVDVARTGSDETALVELVGRRARIVGTWVGKRTTYTSGRVHTEWAAQGYDTICVDDTGAGGGVVDPLLAAELPVVPINFGAAPRRQPARYANLKSEIYGMLRAEFEAGYLHTGNPRVGLSIPPDKRLIHQLTMLQGTWDERQRYKVEGHKEIAKRRERSPDRGDALALANAARAFDASAVDGEFPDVLPV